MTVSTIPRSGRTILFAVEFRVVNDGVEASGFKLALFGDGIAATQHGDYSSWSPVGVTFVTVCS